MIGDQQRHIQQRVFDLVSVGSATEAIVFAEVLQLIDQVKKEKQRQETQRHQRNGGQHLAVDQAAYGFHGLLLPLTRTARGVRRTRGASLRIQLKCRLANQPRPSSSTPPCRTNRKLPKPIRPRKIQPCPRLSRLL